MNATRGIALVLLLSFVLFLLSPVLQGNWHALPLGLSILIVGIAFIVRYDPDRKW